jgi:hypothetical protein
MKEFLDRALERLYNCWPAIRPVVEKLLKIGAFARLSGEIVGAVGGVTHALAALGRVHLPDDFLWADTLKSLAARVAIHPRVIEHGFFFIMCLIGGLMALAALLGLRRRWKRHREIRATRTQTAGQPQ